MLKHNCQWRVLWKSAIVLGLWWGWTLIWIIPEINHCVLHSEQTSIQILFFPSAFKFQDISFSWRSKDLLSQSVWSEICEHCDSLCEYTFLKELGWISHLEESLPLPTSIPPSTWSMYTVYRGAVDPNSVAHLNHFHGIWMLLGDLGDTAFNLTIDDM